MSSCDFEHAFDMMMAGLLIDPRHFVLENGGRTKTSASSWYAFATSQLRLVLTTGTQLFYTTPDAVRRGTSPMYDQPLDSSLTQWMPAIPAGESLSFGTLTHVSFDKHFRYSTISTFV